MLALVHEEDMLTLGYSFVTIAPTSTQRIPRGIFGDLVPRESQLVDLYKVVLMGEHDAARETTCAVTVDERRQCSVVQIPFDILYGPR